MIESHQEVLYGWGRANHARSRVYRPQSPGQVAEALEDARHRDLTVAHRGAGQSYGDAALNQGGAVISTRELDSIENYDPDRGRIRVGAGVTIDRLWRRVIADGWWPPVVPGTSRPTVGGCLAVNVHGKNHFQAGSFAEHVHSITVLQPDGSLKILKSQDPGFDRAVGTQGLFGTILSVELKLRSVASGYLQVEARTAPSLDGAMAVLRRLEQEHDYTVGWLDCFSGGAALGRAEIHGASYLPAGHETAGKGLAADVQAPGPRIWGIVPRRHLPVALRYLVNDAGMRAVNGLKYTHAKTVHPSQYLQAHARFHFLLDYIPEWRRVYGREGMVQYQFFVPEEAAEEVFAKALRLQHDRELVSYLAVLKRHRQDPYPSNYSVDGYSLALDFPVRQSKLLDLMMLVREFDALQRDAGGSVYAAKDSVSRLGQVPDGRPGLFSSNLVRRWRRHGNSNH